jgi:Helix-turn-helix domain
MRTTKEQNSREMVHSLSDRGAFKLKEACAYLGGLAPITVRRLIARGLIKRVPAIRHLLFAKAELDRFLDGGGPRATR